MNSKYRAHKKPPINFTPEVSPKYQNKIGLHIASYRVNLCPCLNRVNLCFCYNSRNLNKFTISIAPS